MNHKWLFYLLLFLLLLSMMACFYTDLAPVPTGLP